MDETFSRFSMLIGEESVARLHKARVMVFGLGGVGGNAVEALARAGIGEFDLIDADSFAKSNLNRQTLSSLPNIGRKKVDVAEERIKSINPSAIVHKHAHFYLPEDPGDIEIEKADFVIDAIDTVSAKMDIIIKCYSLGIPMVSALGCGNRLDPSKLVIADIHKTELDPLAKVIRKNCRDAGIKSLRVVYSTETPIKPMTPALEEGGPRRAIPGSSPFVPPAAGILLAYEAVTTLLNKEEKPAKPE